MTSPRYEFGGWSQSLTRAPLEGFNTQIYGMVTNLAGLYVWAYQNLSEAHRRTIIEHLGLTTPAVTNRCT